VVVGSPARVVGSPARVARKVKIRFSKKQRADIAKMVLQHSVEEAVDHFAQRGLPVSRLTANCFAQALRQKARREGTTWKSIKELESMNKIQKSRASELKEVKAAEVKAAEVKAAEVKALEVKFKKTDASASEPPMFKDSKPFPVPHLSNKWHRNA